MVETRSTFGNHELPIIGQNNPESVNSFIDDTDSDKTVKIGDYNSEEVADGDDSDSCNAEDRDTTEEEDQDQINDEDNNDIEQSVDSKRQVNISIADKHK